MSGQTSVDLRLVNATPGLVADIHAGNEIISAAAQTTEPDTIGFGLVVQRGTNPDNQAIIGGTASGILGITVRSVGVEGRINSATIEYDNRDIMAIMQHGYIFAKCVAGCSPGDPVKFVNATGVLSTGAAALGETTIVGAEWMETAAANGIAKLRLDSVITLTAGV